jgi:peptidoglycan hydrolase-like protein with peptidoglycan-binding domain
LSHEIFRRFTRRAGFGAVFGLAGLAPGALAGSPHLGARVLKQGMSGGDIRTLQTDLTQAGFRTPSVGIFGPTTAHNVVRFERMFHLRVDGIVDAQFVRKLNAVLSARATSDTAGSGGSALGAQTSKGGSSRGSKHNAAKVLSQAPTTTPTTTTTTITPNGGSQHLGERVLRQGMSGHDVRVLQGYLTLAGFATNIDGQFGPGTEQNVIAFQTAHGMSANGVVSYAVAQELRAVVATADPSTGPVAKAQINSDGTATAPASAPAVVAQVIASANEIVGKPYLYAGGHATWNDVGYDCSGSVSFALHGANLLSVPEDSTELESYGSPGLGKWITIYADSSHTWIVVAGIAFDTADYGGPNIPSGTGPRWRTDPTGNLADGGDYVIRHPLGL